MCEVCVGFIRGRISVEQFFLLSMMTSAVNKEDEYSNDKKEENEDPERNADR